MQFRDLGRREGREDQVEPEEMPFAGGAGRTEDLARLREIGDRLFAAGEEAIGRALSGDSEQFLQANRQQGGQ